MPLKIRFLIHYALLAPCLLMLCLFASQGIFAAATLPNAFAACGAWQPTSLPTSPTGWHQEYYRLSPLFAQCLSDANFLAYYGAIQLRTGRVNDALDTLERALLLNPNHGAAQMDYAEALFYNGDPFAARSLNESLLSNRDLPPVIREQIQANQKKLNKLLNTFVNQFNISSGYDSNLNASPSISQLTLTLDGEEWLVALAQGMEPRSGGVLRLGATSRYTQRSANASQSVQLGLNSRLSEYSEDHQHQLTARYQHQYTLLNGSDLKHDVALIGLNHGQKHIFTTLEVRQEWLSAGTCKFNPQHTLGYQDFPGSSYLNAVEYRLMPAVQCGFESLNNADLRLSAGVLFNYALDGVRAGGHRFGQEITANWQQPLPIGRLSVQARYSQWLDADGYNGTMQNNARREVMRYQAAVAYLLPLTPNLLLSTQVAAQQQTSNLELFEYKSRQIEMGVNWQF